MTAKVQPDRRAIWLVAGAVAVGSLAAWWLLLLLSNNDPASYLDLRIYVGAVRQMLAGGDLYAFAISDGGVATPFLYPPFAALLFTGPAVLPFEWAAASWSALQLALLALVLVLVLRGAGTVRPVPILLSWVAALVSLPVLSVLQLGQLGLVLAALVLVDVVLVPPKFRGVLTGVAGAIKLVPLVMVPYFLVTKQWRSAALTGIGFAVATGIAWVVLPAESWQYWTRYAFNTSRFPGIGSGRNLSVLGLLQYVQAANATVIWIVIAVVVLAAGLWGSWLLHRGDQEAAAAILMGVTAGLISPVSWNHHLVWLPLAGAVLALRGRRWFAAVGWAYYAALMGLIVALFYPGAAVWAAVLLQLLALAALVSFGHSCARAVAAESERGRT